MSLTLEWQHRIDRWRKELPRHFYRALEAISLEGFVTKDQLTADEALTGPFVPMPVGTTWGAKWEYGWFKGEVALPQEAFGQRIVLAVDVGGESAVFVNGILAGARDRQHHEVTLATDAQPGTRYAVLIEAYAGHGPRECHAGPTPLWRETVPEPGPTQAMIGETTIGIWAEDVYQLWLDVETLYQLRQNLDENSLRVSEIDQGLRDFTLIVDFELPREEMLETVRKCREHLKPLLSCVNGSTAPTLFAFGHAHIDVAWLWPLAETERKAGRTFATQLALMAEYPEYKYLQSQPHLYRMIKQRYPELYERIKAAIKAGQVIPDGATWVEPDTNVSGGESLIRQFVHGKRFFREEFGVECELLWLPDVFGYSGAMPQIMRGCGVKYFSTQKIFWAYNGGQIFPHNTFVWEGIDGSEVFVHLHNNYNSRTDPNSVIERWNERVQKDGIATRLFPFGFGDGGGGPTRNHLEFIRRQADLEGAPRVKISTPLDYFRDQEARGWPEVRYVGELYFQAHRGTYTSQAKTKRGNRKSEFALHEAEIWGTAAQTLKHLQFPIAVVDEAWKWVLLNQFHDILPGSSIHRVYEQAEAMYASVIETAQDIADQSMKSLVDEAPEALTVFNSISWERAALVPLPQGWSGASLEGGALPVQKIDGFTWAETKVPSCGWATLHSSDAPTDTVQGASASDRLLENALLRITFNEKGEITSIYDKETGREWTQGLCNSLKMYKDVPTLFDAWDIDSMYEQTPVALDEPAAFTLIADGPLVATLRITRKLHHSTLIQDVSLRRDSRRVEFKTTVDWQERHKLLKVAFPVDVHANEAIHEIQFGHIRRPTHRSRPFDADRFEVSNHKWTALTEGNRGFAVLNDCKYGVNVLGNSINLTLLKSALAPDMTADRGMQEFTYAFYAWNGTFTESGVVRESYELNIPIQTAVGDAGSVSLFTIDAPNVVIEAVKLAEDGSGDVVVRLYEAKHMATRCTLSTSFQVTDAKLVDMLENEVSGLVCEMGEIPLYFRPFEIKTLRLQIGT